MVVARVPAMAPGSALIMSKGFTGKQQVAVFLVYRLAKLVLLTRCLTKHCRSGRTSFSPTQTMVKCHQLQEIFCVLMGLVLATWRLSHMSTCKLARLVSSSRTGTVIVPPATSTSL